MASYKIAVSRFAERDLREVPFPARRQLNQRIFRLKEDPRRDAESIADTGAYRLPLHGWSILFEVDDESATVTIVAIRQD